MKFLVLFLFCILLPTTLISAAENDPSNGNLIAEPTLRDYVRATRAPGILVEPYDVVEGSEASSSL